MPPFFIGTSRFLGQVSPFLWDLAMAGSPIDLRFVRNLGIVAHIDAGKTTTSEHVLFYAGAIHRLGAVDSGNTTTDYDPEEQQRGITIYSACIPLKWKGSTLNLIDTPGHVDFTAEVERSLRVLDGCVVVFDAQKGVEAQSETVWRQAEKYQVPRLIFINKMDVIGADFEGTLDDIIERLDTRPVPVVIPLGSGSIKDSNRPFEAVIDIIEQKVYRFNPSDWGKTFTSEEIPEDMLPEVHRWRTNLFDVLTENDPHDLITSLVLEGGAVPVEKIQKLLRQQTIARLIQPLFCGSGREHIGIQPLMDGMLHYLPCPLDRPPVVGINPKKNDKPEIRKPDAKEPFCGLVFKVVADSHGELSFLRIYSGIVKVGGRVLNQGKETRETIGKMFHTEADPSQRTELDEGRAGDIVAIVGLKDSSTGDTLCDSQHPILLEKIQFAQAVVSRSVEPEFSADKDKLADVLALLRREDPTFIVSLDRETGQTLMSGMGMLHLEIKQHRMERDFRLKIRVGKPRVSYRETIANKVKVIGECDRLAGGTTIFAKIVVSFTPLELEEEAPPEVEEQSTKAAKAKNKGAKPSVVDKYGVQVINKVRHDTVPANFVESAMEGLRSSLQSGEMGYPVMKVEAVLESIQWDPAQSNEVAMQVAAADAVRKAFADNIVLLEPVMKLEVNVPEEHLGSVTADLNGRRAEIQDIIVRGKNRVVEAILPMAKLFDYADRVRSITQGRASSTMEPRAYAPAAPEVLKNLLNPSY